MPGQKSHERPLVRFLGQRDRAASHSITLSARSESSAPVAGDILT